MANLNDFKLVAEKSLRYFSLIENFSESPKLKDLDDNKKRILGFYLFALENITGITDIEDLISLITDTEFNKLVFNDGSDDLGVDAIYFDHSDSPRKSIKIFNFKYRENFKPNNQQSGNDPLISQKFTHALLSSLNDGLEISELRDSKIKEHLNEARTYLRSNDTWDLKLYVVSNEAKTIPKDDPNLRLIKDNFGLETVCIGLDDLRELLFDRPAPKSCSFVVNSDAVMSFTENPLDSSKSYIVRLTLTELIRITSTEEDLCNKYNIENIESLKSCELDYSVLYENVRGFVLKSKYNRNIQKTLLDDEEKFFLYNNGITITARSIETEKINGKQKLHITLNGFQVINGGQTLRSVHIFNQSNYEDALDKLNNAQILVRIFQVKEKFNAENKIAEYTNSQNTISQADLKSLRDEQILIEKILDQYEIIYARKTGDLGKSGKSYKHKISMEKLGQILLAINGEPEKSSDKKKSIFEEYYDDLFGESLDISIVPTYVLNYFKIKTIYTDLFGGSVTDQKIFYVFFLNKVCGESRSFEELIQYFESFLEFYHIRSNTNVAKSRLLIQVSFRVQLKNAFVFYLDPQPAPTS